MADELVPIGSVVSSIEWWSTPDKYAGPAKFNTLRNAHEYNRPNYVTVEFRLHTPDGRTVRVVGGVHSVDGFIRRSSRQEDGVQPEFGAVVVDVVRRDRPRDRWGEPRSTPQSQIEDAYDEIVFRNQPSGQFVLIPLTTHPMQDS